MKNQKLAKKLSLNKETVVTLGEGDMNHARGGTKTFHTYTYKPCDTVLSCYITMCEACPSLTVPCG